MAKQKIPYRAVYAIVCDDGRAYVGASEMVGRRWGKHLSQLRHGKHHSRPLQEAWDDLGASAFTFRLLEELSDADDLHEAEQRHIDRLEAANAGFNRCPLAGSRVGLKYSEESKARMSAAQAGRHTGEKNAKSHLTAEDVVEIRRQAACGAPHREIARAFQMSIGGIRSILYRRAWRHIP